MYVSNTKEKLAKESKIFIVMDALSKGISGFYMLLYIKHHPTNDKHPHINRYRIQEIIAYIGIESYNITIKIIYVE